MYARVLRLSGSPTKVAEGIENYRSRVAPALREQDGYSGARLLVNRDTGASMSITFWHDEDTLRASEAALASVRNEAVSQFDAEPPASENYEAVVQHRPQPTEAGNWVRITTLRGDPAKADDGIRHLESTVVPAVAQLTGFRGAVLFVDRATGNALAATIWNTREDHESSSSQIAAVRTRAAEEMGARDPQVDGYEVAFAELLSPAAT